MKVLSVSMIECRLDFVLITAVYLICSAGEIRVEAGDRHGSEYGPGRSRARHQ